MENNRAKMKTKVGVVVSDAMDKTVVVRVDRRVMNAQFKKYINRRKKFLAHDEKNECVVGDRVQMEETKPLSRRKHWKVVKILKKGFGKALEGDVSPS